MKNICIILFLLSALSFNGKAQERIIVASREDFIHSNIVFTILKPHNLQIYKIEINLESQLFVIGRVKWLRDRKQDELVFEIPLRPNQRFLSPTLRFCSSSKHYQLMRVSDDFIASNGLLFCFYNK